MYFDNMLSIVHRLMREENKTAEYTNKVDLVPRCKGIYRADMALLLRLAGIHPMYKLKQLKAILANDQSLGTWCRKF